MDQKELDFGPGDCEPQCIAPGAWWMRGLVGAHTEPSADQVLDLVDALCQQSPFRHMKTPGGKTIGAAMTACGDWGWVSDSSGYRYSPVDPLRRRPWPPMPALFYELAQHAAAKAGFASYVPDTCLVNRYALGTGMGLHRDADEVDFSQPIVSFSFGLQASFRFGGATRKDPSQTIRLCHGDALVWGGPARRNYHGISRIHPGSHARLGQTRINLTFRRAKA